VAANGSVRHSMSVPAASSADRVAKMIFATPGISGLKFFDELTLLSTTA
jgi:hypothetical protein